MKLSLVLPLVLLLIVSAVASGGEKDNMEGSELVVLELFTSQGCSSCPPADRLLRRLAASDANVLPLAYHVDYWNHIGWTDPFSSEAWSKRQRLYGRSLRSDTIYTPQLVFDGGAHCVGSDTDEVERLLASARERARSGKVELQVERTTTEEGVQLDIVVGASVVPGGADLDLLVAVFENDLVTAIPRGENAHRTLENDFVVRTLTKALSVSPGGDAGEKRLQIPVDPDWKLDNLGVAAFLQEPRRLTIHGAAARGVI